MRRRATCTARVHPRERGESRRAGRWQPRVRGPSPRARGILRPFSLRTSRLRSIPASAGNPKVCPRETPPPRVHPRERGESTDTPSRGRQGRGPSPRARGILLHPTRLQACGGSIPASAGNPRVRVSPHREHRVHPRERGESRFSFGRFSFGRGPSPRARGILIRRLRRRSGPRSIPASAGNPIGRRRP